MKINVIPKYFKPTEAFEQLLRGRTYKEAMFDADITDYIEKHSVIFRGRKVCKGRDDVRFRIGFAGCCEVLEVDENQKWIIKYDNIDTPYIQYVNINIDNGYVEVIRI